MKKFVPTVKIVLAFLIMGTVKLLGIKWNPWIAGSQDEDEKEEVE
jgi:hypothetical protein